VCALRVCVTEQHRVLNIGIVDTRVQVTRPQTPQEHDRRRDKRIVVRTREGADARLRLGAFYLQSYSNNEISGKAGPNGFSLFSESPLVHILYPLVVKQFIVSHVNAEILMPFSGVTRSLEAPNVAATTIKSKAKTMLRVMGCPKK